MLKEGMKEVMFHWDTGRDLNQSTGIPEIIR
jgi:hypothetical protein